MLSVGGLRGAILDGKAAVLSADGLLSDSRCRVRLPGQTRRCQVGDRVSVRGAHLRSSRVGACRMLCVAGRGLQSDVERRRV